MKAADIKSLYSSRNLVTSRRYQGQSIKARKLSKSQPESVREMLISWLFLIGSLIFLLDAALENLKGISFSSLLHISASLLFTIGSLLFIPNYSNQQ